MKWIVLFVLLGSLLLVGFFASPARKEIKGLKSIAECSAEDGVSLCLKALKGKHRKFVIECLGKPHRTHAEEEYLYYPERADESTWLLLVEFDGHGRVCGVIGNELVPIPEDR